MRIRTLQLQQFSHVVFFRGRRLPIIIRFCNPVHAFLAMNTCSCFVERETCRTEMLNACPRGKHSRKLRVPSKQPQIKRGMAEWTTAYHELDLSNDRNRTVRVTDTRHLRGWGEPFLNEYIPVRNEVTSHDQNAESLFFGLILRRLSLSRSRWWLRLTNE